MLIGIGLTFIYQVYMLKKANKKKPTLKRDYNVRKFNSLIDDD